MKLKRNKSTIEAAIFSIVIFATTIYIAAIFSGKQAIIPYLSGLIAGSMVVWMVMMAAVIDALRHLTPPKK